jgi:hypothetical protein
LTTAELVRIRLANAALRIEPYLQQQSRYFIAALFFRQGGVGPKYFLNLGSNSEHRVQGQSRFLMNHADLGSANYPKLSRGQRMDVVVREDHGTTQDLS